MTQHNKKPTAAFLATGACAIFLAASGCSSDSSSDPDGTDNGDLGQRSTNIADAVSIANDLPWLGLIMLSEDSRYASMSTLAAFMDWDSGKRVQDIFGSVNAQAADFCRSYSFTSDEDTTMSDRLRDNYQVRERAPTITLMSESGSYGELVALGDTDESQLYASFSELAYPSPEKLDVSMTLDGQDLISFQDSRPAEITGFSMLYRDVVAPNAALSWAASSDNETMITVSFIDASDSPQFGVECLLVDDGIHVLPASLLDESVAAGPDATLVLNGISRVKVSQYQGSDGDWQFIVARSVGLAAP